MSNNISPLVTIIIIVLLLLLTGCETTTVAHCGNWTC